MTISKKTLFVRLTDKSQKINLCELILNRSESDPYYFAMAKSKGRKRERGSSLSSKTSDEVKKHHSPTSKKGKKIIDDPAVLNSTRTTRASAATAAVSSETKLTVDQSTSDQNNATVPNPATPSANNEVLTSNSVVGIKNQVKAKTKPIIINCDSKIALEVIRAADKKLSFPAKVKASRNDHSMITCGSIKDKKVITDLLETKNLEFHSFSEKDEKDQVYILKGVTGYTDDEVNLLLTENLKDFSVKATRISKAENSYPIFKVLFTGGGKVNVESLRHNCKDLGGLIVNWETIKKSQKRLAQCFRCQEFGHVSKQCHREFRCVKCGGNHGPGIDKCSRINKDDSSAPLKCANCSGNHTANFVECPKRKEYLLRMQKSSAKQSTETHRNLIHQKTQKNGNVTSSLPPPGPPPTCAWIPNSNSHVSANIKNPVSGSNILDLIYELNIQIRSLTENVSSLTKKVEELQSERKFHSSQKIPDNINLKVSSNSFNMMEQNVDDDLHDPESVTRRETFNKAFPCLASSQTTSMSHNSHPISKTSHLNGS